MSAAAAEARPLPHSAPVAAWKPRRNPWVVAITVTLATFMEVLDTSIANVALPHIAGGLGASEDEATWVLTSYLVANAVILPASAYMTTFLGRKRFYMICVVLFGISSALCGLAYLDVIKVLAIAMLLLIPLVFLMKRPPKGKSGRMGH